MFVVFDEEEGEVECFAKVLVVRAYAREGITGIYFWLTDWLPPHHHPTTDPSHQEYEVKGEHQHQYQHRHQRRTFKRIKCLFVLSKRHSVYSI